MTKGLQTFQLLALFALMCFTTTQVNAQLEWRLVGLTYNSTDPDGAGLAKGSATFKLQIHKATAGTISNINTISTGWSYQSTKAMVPTGAGVGPGCPATVSNPANVVVSPAFTTAGFTYQSVNQCGVAAQTPNGVGGQAYDRRVVGTLDGGMISLTEAWVDVFTVTLWSLNPLNNSDAGFVIINSGSNASPGAFGSYAVADDQANEYTVNSLSYSTAVLLPLTMSKFDVACTGNGAKINWQTLSEENSSHFEIEKSDNGSTGWTTIGTSNASGRSNTSKNYEFVDLKGGSGFFRIKQVDKDGTFTYTSIQKTNCPTRQASLVVYPVPAKNLLNVVIATDKLSNATITLVDVSGKVVRQLQTQLKTGSNNIKFNVSGVGRGKYFLKVLGPDNLPTQKVTILD